MNQFPPGDVGGPYEGMVWDGVRWIEPGVAMPVATEASRRRRRSRTVVVASLIVLTAVTVFSALALWVTSTVSLNCSQRSVDDFERLTTALPWSVVGSKPSADDFLVFRGVVTDGSPTPDLCAGYYVYVDVTPAEALSGLSDVLRDVGFSDSIVMGGSDSGPRGTFIEGIDANGRTLDITVFADEDTRTTLLDAAVTDP